MVLGPALESDYGSSLEAIVKILRKDLPFIPNFGFEVVDVRDIASLHRIVMENPASVGERILASRDFVWFKSIAEIIDRLYPERKIPKRVMPNLLTKILSFFIPELKQITTDLGREKELTAKTQLSLVGHLES